ncbi:MAG: polyphenol oxidase family protein [Actinomycetota bacterium]
MVFTDRRGGVSGAPYDTLNLGDHVGDLPGAVAENRHRVARDLGLVPPDHWAWLRQVHGAGVHHVGATPAPAAPPVEADAAVTTLGGVPLVVLTADCAPVAIADDVAVGVVHAGWRGLQAGVVAAAVGALRRIGAGAVRAVVGPCIRAADYEFGRVDLDRLVARFGPTVEGRTSGGHPALEVAAGVRVALAEVGVTDVTDLGAGTAGDPTTWFSHRRDGRTGRQGLVVVKDR